MMTDPILSRARQGDEVALNSLLEKHKDFAFNVALKYTGDGQDAADIVQEAFIKVFLHIGQFKSDARFSTWLYRIVYHEALRHRQLKKVHTLLEAATDIAAKEEERSEPLKLTEVRQAMARLTDIEYTVISLFYLGEKPIREIEVITGHSKANIKVILHRARKKLAGFANPKKYEICQNKK
jgi:RNA polymerase sigma-70 factor (ECF subfamily)